MFGLERMLLFFLHFLRSLGTHPHPQCGGFECCGAAVEILLSSRRFSGNHTQNHTKPLPAHTQVHQVEIKSLPRLHCCLYVNCGVSPCQQECLKEVSTRRRLYPAAACEEEDEEEPAGRWRGEQVENRQAVVSL